MIMEMNLQSNKLRDETRIKSEALKAILKCGVLVDSQMSEHIRAITIIHIGASVCLYLSPHISNNQQITVTRGDFLLVPAS